MLVSGHVFEDTQLLALKKIISPGATVVDVGANIGQHTIFFAKNLKAKKVIPIEPNPSFAEIIRENVALNDVVNVDFSLLGYGVGEKEGKCRIVESDISPQDDVVEYDQLGEIPISPLDRLIKEDVHLIKIDVDESELEVLRGMEKILETMRPTLAIEVVHQNLSIFLRIMESFDYRIDHLFSNPQYSDIVAVPRK
jgi:FkbM family methyltransferase